MPAFFCAGILLLQGCSLLPKSEPEEKEAAASPVAGSDKPASQRDAFTVEVKAPDTVRDYFVRHLEIQRYRQLDDLGAAELSRLMVAAEGNARELLGTLGYFTPTLTLELHETPDAKAPREVAITVEPGELTRVANVQIGFSGSIATTPPPRPSATRSAPPGRCAPGSPSPSRPGTTPSPPRCAA